MSIQLKWRCIYSLFGPGSYGTTVGTCQLFCGEQGEGNIPPLVSRCTAKEGAECLTESSCSGSERPDKREKYPFIPKPTSAFNVASTFLKHAKSVSYTAGWAR
ncbi:hypothetical protein (plasmid) [Enterobacter hormaechei subsp. steigerwaltii]|uniref:Uncharacterized protein n=1 Tax=Enterobacter hormaechei subsp. steigerwaltii TaxID=299766 RepID=A0AAX3AI94_9ENTR|nr:hypothetical protein [Enterobacter hormaechei subsp. steigerwaltii]UOL53302.1 hypothetical protein [Enterobacter hormaechei subsp. steigerwaltii]WJR85884.1 hypothetical protein [Enterobacter hormaechei subsp. steigerwaltii]